MDDIEQFKRRKLTPEEVQLSLEAFERAIRHSDEIMARRGGIPFSSSVDIIHEMRAERTRQLCGEDFDLSPDSKHHDRKLPSSQEP